MMHSIRVACRFWPWTRRFWIGLFHDTLEEGRLSYEHLRRIDYQLAISVDVLSRDPDETYSEYITRIVAFGSSDEIDVKRADLLDNYRRCKPSLRKRYARALMTIDGAARG